jgi:hypothetical protein
MYLIEKCFLDETKKVFNKEFFLLWNNRYFFNGIHFMH